MDKRYKHTMPTQEEFAGFQAKEREAISSGAKHTPGPWRAESGSEPGELVIEDAHGVPVGVGRNTPTSTANAHLIAAAPELLEALNAAHDHFIMHNKTHTRSFQLVRAAIAKAEGRKE